MDIRFINRRRWQHEEVIALLKTCIKYKDKFQPRCNKTAAYSYVLQDLTRQRVLLEPTKIATISDKLKKLRLKYRRCILTGAKPNVFLKPYFNLLDKFYEEKPPIEVMECPEYSVKVNELVHLPSNIVPCSPSNGWARALPNNVPRMSSTAKAAASISTTTSDRFCGLKDTWNTLQAKDRQLESRLDEPATITTNTSSQIKVPNDVCKNYFKMKNEKMQTILQKRLNILQNYFIEKQKIKAKALEAKQRRREERVHMINQLMQKTTKM